MIILKAEEEEKQEHRWKTSDTDDDDKKSETEAPATPKLTRLKAKQLNHQLPLHGSLKKSEPSEEVVALIRDELKSDDEDDEYHPGDNDSDDDFNNQTLSDIESQPSTPGSALFQSEQDIDSPMKDGDFKMPRMPSLSAVSHQLNPLLNSLITFREILGRAGEHLKTNTIKGLSHDYSHRDPREHVYSTGLRLRDVRLP